MQAHCPTGPLQQLAALPPALRRLWLQQTLLTVLVWAFYTASPFIFELIHGIPPGSLRR